MLEITINPFEAYDEAQERFITLDRPVTLRLEHSLLSISKWESKYCKSYIDDKTPKTYAEELDYFRCMTINSGVDPVAYLGLTKEQVVDIQNYIATPQTATTVTQVGSSKNRHIGNERITSELIYYWLTSYQIPFQPTEKWHLSRLLALVEVCNAKNQPEKKMSYGQQLQKYSNLNKARRAKLHSKG